MINSSILIGALPESRWEECRDLRLEGLREEPLAFGSSYEEEQLLTEKDWRERIHNAIFALDDNIVVGMVVIMDHTHTKSKHVANIFGVYVRASHRGKGVGYQLIEQAIKKLKESGHIRKISLTVNTVQNSAVALYKKFGFEEAGILKKELFYEGKYYDELIMELLLG